MSLYIRDALVGATILVLTLLEVLKYKLLILALCLGSLYLVLLRLLHSLEILYYALGNARLVGVLPCGWCHGLGVESLFYLLAQLEQFSFIKNPILNKIVLFIMMAICMTIIEYIAGLIFIKGMKVKLWDYSDLWGNIQGIICPLFSFFWAVLGAVYYFFVNPYILDALDWLSKNLAFSFFIGMFFGVFLIDFVYSAKLLSKIKAFAQENDIIVRYEHLKAQISSARAARREKPRFVLAFRSETPFVESLKQYAEKYREKLEAAAREKGAKRSDKVDKTDDK